MGLRGIGAKPVTKERKYIGPEKYRDKPHAWDVPNADGTLKTRAEKVVAFLETLPITSGNLAGTLFRVRDWQRRDIIEPLYATDELAVRFVREAFISLPRKNGKTGLIAGLALCHLCGPEAVERGQTCSGAADRDQAAIIYAEMCAIIERVEWMDRRIIVRGFKKTLEDAVTGSTYKALSSESKTKHGLSLSFWIYDELAQAPDRKLYDVLSTATAAWDEPLGIVISTQAQDDLHIMSELYDDAEQIQSGIVVDRSKHACIYSAPIDADYWDEDVWHACNPALGDFRSLEEMRDFARKAKRMPGSEATFRLLYLNQRVKVEHRFIPSSTWNKCGGSLDAELLRGRECFGALDLSGSGKNDLTSLVLLFDVGDRLEVLPFFWAAQGGLETGEKRDHAPYLLWAKQGYLLTTPGQLLDYGFIAQKLGELTATYDIKMVAVDPWNIDRMEAAVVTAGVKIAFHRHGQSYKDMQSAVTELENAALSGRLLHNRNPVLTWCLDNVMVTADSTGNRKLDKRKSTGRIDGAVSLAMAVNLATATQPVAPEYQVMFV